MPRLQTTKHIAEVALTEKHEGKPMAVKDVKRIVEDALGASVAFSHFPTIKVRKVDYDRPK